MCNKCHFVVKKGQWPRLVVVDEVKSGFLRQDDKNVPWNYPPYSLASALPYPGERRATGVDPG